MAGKVGRPPKKSNNLGRPKRTQAEIDKEKKERLKLASLEEKDFKSMTKGELILYATNLQEKYQNTLDGAYCYICGQHKPKKDFYRSTDQMCKSGVAPVCKDCAKGIARRRDKNGDDHSPTKESVQLALFYLNKPFFEDLWDSSLDECNNENNARKSAENYDVYASYIKNIAMPQYIGMTWKDSDIFKERVVYEDEKTVEGLLEGREDQDTYRDFLKNKKDVKRLLSYDPFEKESLDDQPFLYSQLLGLLDASEDANDDMMRTASCISIVRGFLQQAKIDDEIAKIMADYRGIEKNSGTIKSLQDSKSKITSQIKDLAAESCISLKNSKNSKKGENSWTGKTKKIKDLNLREGEVNGFDLNTCKAMEQIMDRSNASIIKQLRLDESEWSDMVAEMRETIVNLRRDLGNYKEISRILLRENIDLKDWIEEKGVSEPDFLVDLNELFSPFANDGDEVSEDDSAKDDEEIQVT